MSQEQAKREAGAGAAPAAAAAEPKPLLTGPKRHHFLPRFYLEGFAKDGVVAVFDRDKNEVRIQQPVNTAVIGHFYTMEDAQGRSRYELEHFLSEWEGKSAPAIAKLAAMEPLTDDERASLAIFIALGGMRTPDHIDSLKAANSDMVMRITRMMYRDVDTVMRQLRESPEFSGKTDDVIRQEAQGMIDLVQSGGIRATTNQKWAVGIAIQSALQIAPILAGRNWDVLHRASDSKSFVTTDAPVYLTTTEPRKSSFWGVGYGNRDALVLFPLTQACALAMSGNSGEVNHVVINADDMREFNLTMASACQRFVVGRDEALVWSLAKHTGLASRKWESKIRVS